MNNTKLTSLDIKALKEVIGGFSEIEKAFLFGSRAKGISENGSDVDIALKGDDVTFETTRKVSFILNEETNMPYHFDVVNFHAIKNQDLIKHIERVGIDLLPDSCFDD